jgi:hypothetical protein
LIAVPQRRDAGTPSIAREDGPSGRLPNCQVITYCNS